VFDDDPDDLIAEAWRRGRLRYKALPHQVPLYDDMKATLWGAGGYLEPNGPQRKFIDELHRKYGKSTLCGILATELSLQKRDAVTYWGAETSIQVRRFLLPIMNEYVLNDCPKHLQPKWNAQDSEYTFPSTGSKIIIGGCEDEAKCNRLRGPKCDLFIVDEAGQITMLDYLYRSVVLWMVSRTGGRVIMPYTRFCIAAEAGDGGFAKRIIHDSNLAPDLVDELARECGGVDTAAWKREALCERVVDATRAILPEFTDAKATTVCEWPRPEYFDAYTACDIGWAPDLTFVIFAYYDFKAAKLIVEDELVLERMTTDGFADDVIAKEHALWSAHWQRKQDEAGPGVNVPREPYKRTGDLTDLIIADMSKNHALNWGKTAKHDKDSAINELRIWLRTDRIRIHPRCKQLVAHCEAGIWNKRHSEYERIDGFGHFDGVDALIYLRRNIDDSRNPYPVVPFEMRANPHRYHIRASTAALKEPMQSLADMFTPQIGV
jgi:hypothetical protein